MTPEEQIREAFDVPFTFDLLADPDWTPSREHYAALRDAAKAEIDRLVAERDEAQKACNICGKPWPTHHESCAYPGNVRDLRAAEGREADLREKAGALRAGAVGTRHGVTVNRDAYAALVTALAAVPAADPAPPQSYRDQRLAERMDDPEFRSEYEAALGEACRPEEPAEHARGYEVVGVDSVTNLPIRRYDPCPGCGSTMPPRSGESVAVQDPLAQVEEGSPEGNEGREADSPAHVAGGDCASSDGAAAGTAGDDG